MSGRFPPCLTDWDCAQGTVAEATRREVTVAKSSSDRENGEEPSSNEEATRQHELITYYSY